MPKFKINNGDITVSADFIQNIMPELNGAFVKVYLYTKYLASRGEDIPYSVVADKLGLLESEVSHAMDILSDCGLLNISGGEVLFVSGTAWNEEKKNDAAPVPVDEPKEDSGAKVQYSVTQMSHELESNKSLSDMLKVAQEVMGKPLNNNDINTLFWFYEGLHFSPEVILMLLEYCVSADKRSIAYAEKVAINWHERGVTTIEDVEKIIADENDSEACLRNLKRIFGINDRNFTQMEKNFIKEWQSCDNMSEEMIALAYEYSILQINKLSFPYMNKIIKRWKKDGIFTVEAAERDNEKFRNKASANGNTGAGEESSDYDYEAIEKRMWDNI